MSLVSGSQVSAAPIKKKRGRKSKAELASHAAAASALRDGTPSIVGGPAATAGSTVGGNIGKDAEVDGGGDIDGSFELPENMASRSAARTKEQIEEEKELVALLKSQMDDIQFDRYEVWHRQSIKPNDVKRVCYHYFLFPFIVRILLRERQTLNFPNSISIVSHLSLAPRMCIK